MSRRRPLLETFGAFILTNGRPDRVRTYASLRSSGYTGPIFLLVDDLDKTREEYISKYGDQVVIFDKRAVAKTFDTADNFDDMRAIVYARNASFAIARRLGLRHFIQLDDDYSFIQGRFDRQLRYSPSTPRVLNMDVLFEHLLQFYEASGVLSLALAQGGDFVGGENNLATAQAVRGLRKCMNTFICSVDRPFQFLGRVNEDVNTYTHLASKGALFLTTTQLAVSQTQTQSNSGGMTELYLSSGTYLKSFYTVMFSPGSVKVRFLQSMGGRLHHSVDWRCTVPKILSETLRKTLASA